MKKGDVVIFKENGNDILCEISSICTNDYNLRGLEYRFEKTCSKNDIEKISLDSLKVVQNNNKVEVYTKVDKILKNRFDNYKPCVNDIVLHIDSDNFYLDLCVESYGNLGIDCIGINLPVSEQPKKILNLLEKYNPGILVITGHDSFIEDSNKKILDNYENSKYFINTVKIARDFKSCKDNLVIIAGACQSYYEEIIKAGANYASSPQRILVHALDPSFIAEKVIYSSINCYLSPEEAIENTHTGLDGFGGIETRGRKRISHPSVFH